MKLMVYIVQILALAAPSAALMEFGYASSQLAVTDRLVASAEMAGPENAELSATPSNTIIDDWGTPLFTPGHAG